MGKSINTLVLDAALDFISTNGNRMTACSAEPTTYTEGNATYALADVTLAGGDYTKAAGDTNGRKVTIAQKTGITVDSTGTANHVAILDTTNSRLLAVTTATSQALTSGNTLTINSWKYEINNPT